MKIRKYALFLLTLSALTFTVACDKSPNTDATQPTSSEETVSEKYPAYQIIDNEKRYGYIDSKGNFVNEPTSAYASDFSEGYAVTYDNTTYRLVDMSGNTLFESTGPIEPFKNGAAVFTDAETYKKGFVDASGNVIAKPIYLTAENFNAEGVALVSSVSGTFDVIDKTGKTVKSYVLDPKYESIYSTLDGYAAYTLSVPDGFKMGILSIADNRVVIEPTFNEVTVLGEGYFAAKDPEREIYDAMVTPSAIFNSKGEQLSDYVYYDITPYHEGLASATDENSTFFIGTDGQKVTALPTQIGRGTLIKMGALIKADINGNLSYLDEKGNTIWAADRTRALTDSIKVVENDYNPSRLIQIKYPSIEGLESESVQSEINEILKAYFTEARSEEYMVNLSVEDNFSATIMEDLLIIGKDGYDYYAGAAHGMPIRDFYYIDIKTGTLFTFKDLFKAESGYLDALSERVRQEIQRQMDAGDAMFFPESFTGLSEFANFMLSDTGVTVYFYPYDISAYAAGFPEFAIPFDKIMEYIDVEGNFWKSFHGID